MKNFGNKGRFKDVFSLDFSHDGLGHLRLLWIGKVNATSVLGAAVIALAIQSGGVVDDKENFQQHPGTDDLGVIDQPHHLVVARHARADLLIRWVAALAIAIARFNVQDTFNLDKDSFGAPEAAAPKNQSFSVRWYLHPPILTQNLAIRLKTPRQAGTCQWLIRLNDGTVPWNISHRDKIHNL